MSSILTFAWRKSVQGKGFSLVEEEEDDMLPDVAPAISEEESIAVVGTPRASFPSPQTPEGLRPRPSADELRNRMAASVGIEKKRLKMPSIKAAVSRNHIASPPQRQKTKREGHLKVDVELYEHEYHHYVSTNEQSRTSDDDDEDEDEYTRNMPVAQSPNIQVGRAKTAVGNLLASYGINSQTIIPPPEAKRSHLRNYSKNMGYQASNQQPLQRTSIEERMPGFPQTPPRPKQQRVVIPLKSPESSIAESAMCPSPSSYDPYYCFDNDSSRSDHSRRYLMTESSSCSEMGRKYDFDEIVVEDRRDRYYVEEDVCTQVSGISQFSANSGIGKNEQNDAPLTSNIEPLWCTHQVNGPVEKEQRLIDVLICLQNDDDLVSHILSEEKNSGKAGGFFRLFAGSVKTQICDRIDELLRELAIAVPEDYMLSPSQVPLISDTHEELRASLLFCCRLLGVVPRSFDGGIYSAPRTCSRDVRAGLGLDRAYSSPEVARGGDTSLFSLPSDSASSTPHTSNVSLTTTITSIHSPSKFIRSNGRIKKICESIRTIVRAFHRLGEACSKLISTNAIQASRDIKRIYKELVSIDSVDLAAVLASFDSRLPPLHIARVVSEERDDILESYDYYGAASWQGRNLNNLEEECENTMFSPTTADMASVVRLGCT